MGKALRHVSLELVRGIAVIVINIVHTAVGRAMRKCNVPIHGIFRVVIMGLTVVVQLVPVLMQIVHGVLVRQQHLPRSQPIRIIVAVLLHTIVRLILQVMDYTTGVLLRKI